MREASVPEEFLPFWFARLLHVNMASALASRYVAFADAAESSLRQALAFRGLPLDVVPAALHAMRNLEPWEDPRVCLETLRQAGHTLVALSNSSVDTIRTLIDGAKLGPLFESIVSSDEVRRPKPDPTPYWRALQRSDVPAGAACFVAAHAGDIQGASAVGLPTIWISRLEKAWSFPSGPPGRTVTTLKEVPATVADVARTQAMSSG